MPLPTNSSLILLPSSKPGDALHAKPKHAMLVRMSSQTLDALESFPTQPQVQVQFGENAGIYIGETYFPIQHSPENSIHELYLRASSAAKKTAPLKLYANVVGKFAVERELADDLREKIRESTQDAAAQRNNRITVMLDTPPDLSTNNRKRKDPPGSSSMFRKPLRPADKPKVVPAPLNATPPSKLVGATQRDLPVPLRKRMIQCLAVSDRTEDNITKLVAGQDATPAMRRDVQDLLEEIAEPIMGKASDKSPKTYRLKPVSWKEARPYEWSGLSESERTSIARAARVAFQNLSIPESDPIWNHVRYRSPGSFHPSTSQHTSSSDQSKASNPAEERVKKDAIPKRGVSSSRDTKDKKAKPKNDKAEIMMKDESKPIRMQPPEARNDPRRPSPAERRVIEHKRTPSMDSRRNDPLPNRRAPDHGDRRPAAPELKSAKSTSRQDDPSPATSASKSQRQVERPVAPSVSAPKMTEEKSLSSQRIKKIRRETANGGASDSDRERPLMLAERTKAKEKMGRRDANDSPRDDVRSSSAAKRKAAVDYDDDDFEDGKARSAAQKRRKTEPVLTPAQRDRERERERESERNRDRDSRKDTPKDKDRERARDRGRETPRERERDREDKLKGTTPINRKSHNETRPQAKSSARTSTATATSSRARHDSPSPAFKQSSSSTARGKYSPASPVSSNLNPSTSSYKSGSSKPRRRSPIYTSSEEEEEDVPLKTTARPDTKKSKPSAPTPDATSALHTRDREVPSKALPTDHAALRARYDSSYIQYLASFQQLASQRGKLAAMLKRKDPGSSGSITDSDGDIMEDEELAQLADTHKKLRDELESIQLAFGRTTKSGELMPASELLTA